jgi:hypothetical protein
MPKGMSKLDRQVAHVARILPLALAWFEIASSIAMFCCALWLLFQDEGGGQGAGWFLLVVTASLLALARYTFGRYRRI